MGEPNAQRNYTGPFVDPDADARVTWEVNRLLADGGWHLHRAVLAAKGGAKSRITEGQVDPLLWPSVKLFQDWLNSLDTTPAG